MPIVLLGGGLCGNVSAPVVVLLGGGLCGNVSAPVVVIFGGGRGGNTGGVFVPVVSIFLGLGGTGGIFREGLQGRSSRRIISRSYSSFVVCIICG